MLHNGCGLSGGDPSQSAETLCSYGKKREKKGLGDGILPELQLRKCGRIEGFMSPNLFFVDPVAADGKAARGIQLKNLSTDCRELSSEAHMNSQWNLENGSFVPPENGLWSSTWAPLTPEKPISAFSNADPASIVQMTGHLIGMDSWQQLATSGLANGYLQEMPSCIGSAQGLNLNEVAAENEITEQNAGLSTDIFEVDGVSWSDRPFTDILTSASLGFSPLTTGASGGGLGVAQDFWSLNNLSSHSNCGNVRSGSHSAPIANRGKTSGIDALWNDCMPAQVPQCGFPLPSRPMYDLNSIPPIEGNPPPCITNALQYVPETPDQVQMGKYRPSATNNSTPDERLVQESNKQEEIPRDALEGTQNNSQFLLENIGECSRQNQENPVEHVEGIDLNVTPQLKHPKRRKHRPKVIVEGKPKRAKPKEAKEKAHGKESTVVKRKYVRRKGLNDSVTQQPNFAGTAESQNQAAAKSSRRALNFDSEQTTESINTCEQDKMKITNQLKFGSSAHSQNLENLTVNGFMHDATAALQIHLEEVSPIQNQPVFEQGYAACAQQKPLQVPPVLKGVATGFSSVKTKDQQIQDLRGREARDTIRVNSLSDLMNGHLPAQHTNKEVRRVGLQGERNLNLARTSQQTSGQLAASIFSSNVEERGSKRAYYQSNEQAFPPTGSSTTFQTIWQLLQIARSRQNSNTVDSDLFNALKKKKKIENRLNAQRDGMLSWVSGANNSSRQGHLRLSNGVVTPMPSQLPADMQNVSELDNIYRRIRERISECPQECYSSPGFASNKRENHGSAQLQSYLQWKEVAGRVLNANSTDLRAVQTCKIQLTPENSSPSGGKEKLKVQQKSLPVKVSGSIKLQPAPSRGKQKHDNKEMQHLHQLSGAKNKGSSSQREDCNPLDQIIHQLCRLNLNGEGKLGSAAEHTAVVLYKGDGTIIPYEGPEPRRRKTRPKIDLDPETNRMWNLLMGKESESQQNDKDKEKWWQDEREVFRGRANSFIARMHLIQGDRRFSRWKGSVVDSVIGVFLTQNVSDHLSSSAFMSLVARFPPRSTINSTTPDKSCADLLFKEPVPHRLNPRGTLVSHENMQQISSKTLLECWSVREFTGMERRNLMEGQTHSSEDIISSQESFDCSITEGCGGVRSSSGSNSESEDIANHLKLGEISCTISGASLQKDKFMSQELLQSSNSKVALEHKHRQFNSSIYDHQSWTLDRDISTNGNSWCDSPVNSEKQPILLSPHPSIESQMQLKDSKIPRAENDIFAEDSMGSSLTMLKFSDAELQSRAPLNERVLLGFKEKQLMTCQHTTISSSHTCSPSFISGPNPTNSQLSYIQHIHEQEKSIIQEASYYATNADDLREPIAPKQDSMNYASSINQKTVLVDCRVPGVDRSFHSPDTPVQINPTKQLSSLEAHKETQTPAKAKRKAPTENRKIDWDNLRKEVQFNGGKKERSEDTIDSIDYEALRQASTGVVSETIRERGMNNMLAERIKGFLDRLVEEHGSIDLEWLRDVSPDKAKDYLLSIRGLGLKSVECVRLLTLHNLAFPVDTNVGRIAVRLGWVPLQPLPESLQLHLLELYPVLESIQKYLWPRLCKLDQPTLYELHYQLITFGKVFCTKSRPNCNGCPMRGECRHFASAFASARQALPAPEDKSLVPSTVTPKENTSSHVVTQMLLPPVQDHSHDKVSVIGKCYPIIEEPATPEEECAVALDRDIEDFLVQDDDEIPTIKLNIKEFTDNLQTFMQENNMELQEADMSKALVALNPEAASIPARKLKNVNRLRTEHQVYELPDYHPLLKGLEKREADDPSPYLLAIWTPGETPNSVQQPREPCKSQNIGSLCNEMMCFSCNSIREAQSQTVRGTLLIPCRTAMRGSFPLNGTYFQVNEMFADHESSLEPVFVPRDSIWNLRRRTVYFGTSVTAIFRGLSTEEVQYCFWRGFVCVRGFERETRSPRPLVARLHFPASKSKGKTNREKDVSPRDIIDFH